MSKLYQVAVKPGDRVLFPGDIHFPAQDDRALEVMTEQAIDLGVTKVFCQGDTFDYWGLSKYPKNADRALVAGRLVDEVGASAAWLPTWADLFACWMAPGNHEDRWYDLVDANPALQGTEWFEPVERAGLTDGWTILGRNYRAKFGPLLVEHGNNLTGSLRKHSAAAVLAEYPGQNTLYGHTHRVDSSTRPTRKDGEAVSHGAWTIGHMSDEEKNGDYMENKAWEKGFAIVDFWQRSKGVLGFTVNQARVFNDGKRRVCNLLGKTKRA